MLFTRIFGAIWRYFDVLCYILGVSCLVGFGFCFGLKWGLLATAIALFFVAYLSELIAANSKGGDN
ncbi:DUF1056 family protein [Fructilactobacillus cliffordii]|uniref:DUF1056 family protein n=1 Tax=Fructilactobacillus cliffordii TaxID=2940299 RepID=UPI0020939F4C|nr:DUF1056 family protein [Fructilactobacillus cliffordii]USS86486.1 DUF1056 family protein [Fructilactobacillus cliffordii]